MEAVHYTAEQLNERFSFSGKLKTNTIITLVLGIILLALGAMLLQDAPAPAHGHEAAGHGAHAAKNVTFMTRFTADFLLTNVFFFRLAIGAFVFIVLSTLGGAGWLTAFRRIPEAMSMFVFVSFIGFIVLFGLMDNIYEWLHSTNPLVVAKQAYLNKGFFIGRNLFFFAVWGAFVWLMRKASTSEDTVGGLDAYNKTGVYAAVFMIIFALTYSLFCVDWLKSLEPTWFSTIYGVYVFAGTMVSSITTIMLLVIILKRHGYLSYVNDSHLHDLGKFMFGFSVFWSYIWVSQLLLIWYSNVPEESIYYVRRMGGNTIFGEGATGYENYQLSAEYLGYKFFFFFNIIANFVTPFLVLMMRNAKRVQFILYPMCFFMLMGHWNDLYQLIMPGAIGQHSASFASILMQIGMMLTFAGVFLFVVFSSLAKYPLVTKNNPYLEESLHHSTGVI
ncbi:MAG: hypothetical protein ACKVTZ_20385 [Bacteroidia bacterium]